MRVAARLPSGVFDDAETLWRFHRLDDEPRPVDVAIGLGSHNPTVPAYAAELYHQGLFPWPVFIGGQRADDGRAVPIQRSSALPADRA